MSFFQFSQENIYMATKGETSIVIFVLCENTDTRVKFLGIKAQQRALKPSLLYLSIWKGKEAEWLPKFTVLSHGLEGMLLASVGLLAPCPSQAPGRSSALPWIQAAGSFPHEPVSRVSPFLLSWQYWMCWH